MNDWYVILRGNENSLFVVPALPAFLALVYARSRHTRIASSVVLLVALLPHIQRGVGNVYLAYPCKYEAGEFIYRTVDHVDGLLMMRWRGGRKDHPDRCGDVAGATTVRIGLRTEMFRRDRPRPRPRRPGPMAD